MRHNLNVPVILRPSDRVPALQFEIDEKVLCTLILQNKALLTEIGLKLVKDAQKYVSKEFLEELQHLPAEQHESKIYEEASYILWKPFGNILISAQADQIVEQALNYCITQHAAEVPYEADLSHREQLQELVGEILTVERMTAHPIVLQVDDLEHVTSAPFRKYLGLAFTEVVRDIYTKIHELEEPVEMELYSYFFNDLALTKYNFNILSRFLKQELPVEELVEFAKEHPQFFMTEILGNRSRIIDKDPNIAADEKLTQKASAYQLLKEIFLTEAEPEIEDEKPEQSRKI